MRVKVYLSAAFLIAVSLSLTGCNSNKRDYGTATNATVTPAQAATAEGNKASAIPVAVEEKEPQVPENGIAFSRTNYFYTDSINLEILSNKPCEIYYTLDGTDPSREQKLYAKPIRLNANNTVMATSVRAKAYFEDGTESDTITHTYFMGKDAESRYDTLIFSITTDPYNLYDYEYGIFVGGKLRDEFIAANPGVEPQPNDPANFNMRGTESEREVYLEVFEPKGSLVLGQAAGIRTYGGWSRSRAQKSFKIYARKEYDENNNKLDYEFFPYKTSADEQGNILDSFKQLVLRNCGNDNGFGFIRDELFETLAGQAGYKDYEAVRPAAVFVNGDYRGFFWLHEVYGNEYFEDHYGKHDGSFEIIEGGETFKTPSTSGDNVGITAEYDSLYYTYCYTDLTNEANYQSLRRLIDVENYLEYYALQVYIGNEDWPHNNYKAYRYYAAEGEEYREAPFDGKWRYLLHDLDFSFGIYGTPANTDFLSQYVGSKGEIREASPLFGQLMKRADCREIFVKKTLDLINGAFSYSNLGEVLDTMNEERLNEIMNTYNKGLIEEWVSAEDLPGRIKDIKTYNILRADYTLTSYQEFFKLGAIYQLNVQPAEECKVVINSFETDKVFKGKYYSDYDMVVTALLPKGKKIDYWLVNGEKVKIEDLVVTSSMVREGKVEVSFVIK